jgi:hypothetical protein
MSTQVLERNKKGMKELGWSGRVAGNMHVYENERLGLKTQEFPTPGAALASARKLQEAYNAERIGEGASEATSRVGRRFKVTAAKPKRLCLCEGVCVKDNGSSLALDVEDFSGKHEERVYPNSAVEELPDSPPTEEELIKATREKMEAQADSLAVEIIQALNAAKTLPAIQQVVGDYELPELFLGVPLDKRFTAAESEAINSAFERAAHSLGFQRGVMLAADAEVTEKIRQSPDHPFSSDSLFGDDHRPDAPPLTQQIHPSKITTHPSTLMRADGLDAEYVEELREAYARGERLPPVDLYFDGTTYWLGDGNHRHAGALAAGVPLDIRLHKGALRDAILHAVRANAEHGKRRSNDDKRLAVLTVLSDPEWFKESDTTIARMVGNVSQPFVLGIRHNLAVIAPVFRRYAEEGDKVMHRADSDPELRGVPEGLVRILLLLPDEQRESLTHNVIGDDRRRRGSDGVTRRTPLKSSEQTAPLFTEGGDGGAVGEVTSAVDDSEVDGGEAAEVEEVEDAAQTPPVVHSNAPVADSSAADAVRTPAQPRPATEAEPAGWSELVLTINLSVSRGKGPRRGVVVSGRAGEGAPVFLSEFTFADLEPLPPALASLLSRLKEQYAGSGAKVAAARTAQAKPAVKKPAQTKAAGKHAR